MLGSKKSTARTDLRAAIADRTTAQRERDARAQALDRARALVHVAEEKIHTARAAIEAAHQDRTEQLLHAVNTGAPIIDSPAVSIARRAEREAEDDRSAAQTVVEKCEAALAAFEGPYAPSAEAARAASAAVRQVIMEEIDFDRLIASSVEAFDKAAKLRATIVRLQSEGLVPPRYSKLLSEHLRCGVLPYVAALGFADDPKLDCRWPDHDHMPQACTEALEAWSKVIDHLLKDPDAKLPT